METYSLLAWAPGGQEWLIIGLIVVVLFGAKKIPELARGLGSGMKEFKKAIREGTEEETGATKEKPSGGNDSH